MDRFRLPVAPPSGTPGDASPGRRLFLWGAAAAAALLVAADAGLPSLERVATLRTGWPETTAYMELRRAQARRQGRTLEIAWEPVPLSHVPDPLVRAVLVAEDAGFYGHHGFDPAELRAALKEAWREREAPRGASTLTMQLARNLYLSPETTLWRKLREAIVARRLEAALGKRRILELYLNVVELGPGVFGVQAASRTYWGVGVDQIGPVQAVELAATLPSPRRNNPRTRTRAFRWRRELIADRVRADTLEEVRPEAPAPPPDSVRPAPELELPAPDTVASPADTGSGTEAGDTTAVDTSTADSIGVSEETGRANAAPDTSRSTPGGRSPELSGPEAQVHLGPLGAGGNALVPVSRGATRSGAAFP